MKGNGIFSTHNPDIANFLSRIGSDAIEYNTYEARNFLIDESVKTTRLGNYDVDNNIKPTSTFEDWKVIHEQYLFDNVFLTNTTYSLPPSVIDPNDADLCPETFKIIDSSSPFHRSDSNLHLIRIVDIQFIANVTGETINTIKSVAEDVVNSSHSNLASINLLNSYFEFWNTQMDFRPVFAGYWEEFSGLFNPDPILDNPNWTDVIRDRLGLLHYDPSVRPPIDVIAFRYSIDEIPKLVGAPSDTKPLVPPSVLDTKFSKAFCPSPIGNLAGHTVDLSMSEVYPCQEVLHPNVALKSKHVWRVGQITKPVEDDILKNARPWHLMCVRDFTGRSDYAIDTDG